MPYMIGPRGRLTIVGVFAGAASLGFRGSLWIVCAALAAQGLQDALHGRFVDNPGVPA